MMEYMDFLRNKIEIAPDSGFEVDPSEVSSILKPHERDSVVWMVKGGRRALFSSFGLGKTITQLEAMRLILNREGGKALIVCPLNVRHVFRDDARRLLGIDIQYVRSMAEAEASAPTLFDLVEATA